MKKPTPRLTALQETELATLWDVLPHPTTGHVVRLFSRKADSRGGDFARSLRELRVWASARVDRNIYVAPNPTTSTSGERHSARDVTHWSFFLIDIDPIEKKYNIKKATSHVLNAFANMAPCGVIGRPIVIDSGRGCQLWYRLPDLITDASTEEGIIKEGRVHPKTARKINGYWLAELDRRVGLTNGCRIDTSVSDLPRVMRCPGTYNVKTGKMARIIEANKTVFESLPQCLLKPIPKSALIDPVLKPGAPGLTWQKAHSKLTLMAQTYLLEGQVEPGRHKVLWHTARKLCEVGVSREETYKALNRANKLKGEDNALDQKEIEHALNTAYQKD